LNKKKFRRKKFKAEFNEKELHQIIDLGKNPEQIVEFNMIYEKILQLPQKMSEALILFYINDLTLEDIQKIQGDSLSGVKQRIKRGREKLFSLLDTPEQIKIASMFFTL
jgi:DNA-directed RNA polymerase specialized sigma24 family protein